MRNAHVCAHERNTAVESRCRSAVDEISSMVEGSVERFSLSPHSKKTLERYARRANESIAPRASVEERAHKQQQQQQRKEQMNKPARLASRIYLSLRIARLPVLLTTFILEFTANNLNLER